MDWLAYLFTKLLLGFASFSILFSSLFSVWPSPIAEVPSPLIAPPSAPVVEIPRIQGPATTTPPPRLPAQPGATQPPPAPRPTPPPSPTPQPQPRPAPAPQPTPAPSPAPSGDLNEATREALVNVICTTKAGGSFRPTSGSGVIIDPRGVILTNAHIGQFFLLRDYPTEGNVDCMIRVGSPAQARYRAELLYLPPSWMARNAHKIVQEVPTGTGEDDWALLRITGRTDPTASLPSSFPYLTSRTDDNFEKGDPLLLAGYPAGFLGGATVQTNLFISSAFSDIKEVYTYDSGSIDLISVGGTVVSQQGSSGGAVVTTTDQKLAALIVTSTIAEQTADRDLRAITLYHVNESVKKNTGFDLSFLLFGDIALKSSAFNITIAPTLANMLITEIER